MRSRYATDADTAAERAEASSEPASLTFRIVSVVVALWFTALAGFGLTEPVLMFLPAESLGELAEDVAAFESDRMHYLLIGVVAWSVVLSVWTQVRRPRQRVAPMLVLIAWAVGSAIVYGLSGTLTEWLVEEMIVVVLPVGALALLHPERKRLLAVPRFDNPMIKVAALAAVPWAVYAFTNAVRQIQSAAGDVHAPEEHWARAALVGIVLIAEMILGSSDHRGAGLPAWIVSVFSVILGVHSLVFPEAASALPALFAVAAIGWGVAFAVLTGTRGRRAATASVG